MSPPSPTVEVKVSKANPYVGLPARAFWRSGVVESSPFSPPDIYRKKFSIGSADKIATAGSCFAQHIGRFLSRSGYSVLDAEPAPPWVPGDLRAKYGYGIYSARYGNIYTVAQLAQLAAECVGAFSPAEFVWRRGDRYVDGLRPAVEPDGFESMEELLLARRFHLERVRALFSEMDVFVFTLGLTEAWVHRATKTFFALAPGVVGGVYDPAAYGFVNLKYNELVNAFGSFFKSLEQLRGGRLPRVILTVSPVPLTATASAHHVLPATVYSKGVLRAVAGDLAEAHDFIDYFPSFEIVTNPSAHGAFFDSNLRTVRPAGVQAAMASFFEAHGRHAGASDARDAQEPGASSDEDMDLLCEEAILAAFGS
jgi:hypothetical protein